MRLVINPDQSMACAERLSIGPCDLARAGSVASAWSAGMSRAGSCEGVVDEYHGVIL